MTLRKLFLFVAFAMVAMVANAQLPSVKLKTLDGKTIDTSTLSNDGKPFVISFFATWCKPCNRELKAISEHYADWQEETTVKLYAISIDQAQNINKVKPLVDGFGWEYEVLLDPNGDFKRAMNVQNVPHLFILDGKGKIVYNHTGYTDGGETEIYEIISKL